MKRSDRDVVAKKMARDCVEAMETISYNYRTMYCAILTDKERSEIEDVCIRHGLDFESKLNKFKRGVK